MGYKNSLSAVHLDSKGYFDISLSYLLMNYSWAPVYTLSPDQVYRLHHPAISNNHTFLCKHDEIIHMAEKHKNTNSKIAILPKFYPVKP